MTILCGSTQKHEARVGGRERAQDARLVQICLWVVLVVCIVIGFFDLAFGLRSSGVVIFVSAVMSVGGIALSVRGRHQAATITLCAAVTWAIVASAFLQGGVYSEAVIALPVLILIGALLPRENNLGLLLTTSISVLSVFALAALQLLGLIVAPRPPLLYAAAASVLFIALGILAAAVQHNWRENYSALQRLADENSELYAAEHELTARLKEKDAAIRRAYVDVIDAATGGKFILMTPDEIAVSLGRIAGPTEKIERAEQIGKARGRLREALRSMTRRVRDPDALELAAGEAVTNAWKHGESAECVVRETDCAVQYVVCDHGSGIDFKNLPKVAFVPGFSTKASLGMGFTIMLDACDRVLLSTEPGLTCIVLEMDFVD